MNPFTEEEKQNVFLLFDNLKLLFYTNRPIADQIMNDIKAIKDPKLRVEKITELGMEHKSLLLGAGEAFFRITQNNTLPINP